MKIFTTNDKSVTKYVHRDKSETCIKTVPSCIYNIDPDTKELTQTFEDRNKYTIFISSSFGCIVGCKFCYLTTKNCSHTNIGVDQIVSNVQESISHFLFNNPEYLKKNIKLSWMGMGDALINVHKTIYATKMLVDWLIKTDLTPAIDGIDIGTALPTNFKFIPAELGYLNEYVTNHRVAKHEDGRSAVRIFYSLHSLDQDVRYRLIPHSIFLKQASDLLFEIFDNDIDIICHQLFLEGVNDYDIDNFYGLYEEFCSYHDYELRVLRFNECEGGEFMESSKFNLIVDKLQNTMHSGKLKIQHSAGKEILSACGQFIVNDYIEGGSNVKTI